VIGVDVDVAAAHDGDDVPTDEAVAVFEDGRDAERGRRFDDQAGVVQEHPHPGDDRRLGDQDGVVGDQQEVGQDRRDRTPAGDTVGDGVSRVGGDDARRWCQECVMAGAPAGWTQITSVPRALKLRTGLAVSSLMLTAHPRTGSSASQRYSGVPRKTGSITRRAARIRAVSRRVTCTEVFPVIWLVQTPVLRCGKRSEPPRFPGRPKFGFQQGGDLTVAAHRYQVHTVEGTAVTDGQHLLTRSLHPGIAVTLNRGDQVLR